MKAKERQTKESLSIKELEAELHVAQEKRFKLAFKHRSSPLDNPIQLRTLRRDIARFRTWIAQKKSAAGAQGEVSNG